jgi:presenilin-like A22 family membrane protease
MKAAAVTGHLLIIAVVTGFLVEIARGHSGSPFTWLGAIAGLTYVLGVAYFRWRG